MKKDIDKAKPALYIFYIYYQKEGPYATKQLEIFSLPKSVIYENVFGTARFEPTATQIRPQVFMYTCKLDWSIPAKSFVTWL